MGKDKHLWLPELSPARLSVQFLAASMMIAFGARQSPVSDSAFGCASYGPMHAPLQRAPLPRWQGVTTHLNAMKLTNLRIAGAFIGKATPAQVLWLAIIFVPLYAMNQQLVFTALGGDGDLCDDCVIKFCMTSV